MTITQQPLFSPAEFALRERMGAEFSPDRVYRYLLWRQWGPGPTACFCMLNPSKADESRGDATVDRQVTRCQGWLWSGQQIGRLVVVNLFAYPATKRRDMKRYVEPVGPDNDFYIAEQARLAIASGGLVVCAWGDDGKHLNREEHVLGLLAGLPLHCLATNEDGSPTHPLYLPYSLQPRPYSGRVA